MNLSGRSGEKNCFSSSDIGELAEVLLLAKTSQVSFHVFLIRGMLFDGYF